MPAKSKLNQDHKPDSDPKNHADKKSPSSLDSVVKRLNAAIDVWVSLSKDKSPLVIFSPFVLGPIFTLGMGILIGSNLNDNKNLAIVNDQVGVAVDLLVEQSATKSDIEVHDSNIRILKHGFMTWSEAQKLETLNAQAGSDLEKNPAAVDKMEFLLIDYSQSKTEEITAILVYSCPSSDQSKVNDPRLPSPFQEICKKFCEEKGLGSFDFYKISSFSETIALKNGSILDFPKEFKASIQIEQNFYAISVLNNDGDIVLKTKEGNLETPICIGGPISELGSSNSNPENYWFLIIYSQGSVKNLNPSEK